MSLDIRLRLMMAQLSLSMQSETLPQQRERPPRPNAQPVLMVHDDFGPRPPKPLTKDDERRIALAEKKRLRRASRRK